MSRYKAGSKAAQRRLRLHAEAMQRLEKVKQERQAALDRLASQEAQRATLRAFAIDAWREAQKIKTAQQTQG